MRITWLHSEGRLSYWIAEKMSPDCAILEGKFGVQSKIHLTPTGPTSHTHTHICQLKMSSYQCMMCKSSRFADLRLTVCCRDFICVDCIRTVLHMMAPISPGDSTRPLLCMNVDHGPFRPVLKVFTAVCQFFSLLHISNFQQVC